MINSINYNNYSAYNNITAINPRHTTNAVSKIQRVAPVQYGRTVDVSKTNPADCKSCKSRKYVDGSNDMNVSFKTPGNISPKASFSIVSAHEGEHVANAVSKGNQPGAELISASVSLKMSVCPECGTPYVAGGETRTQISYDESNPYENNRKSVEGSLLKGMNVDYVA